MEYDLNNILSRIRWCRRQQQLHSITPIERAGWRAEETGLLDALGCRDHIDFMRKEHRVQFMRYLCGLEDGQALLRLSTSTPRGMTRMEGLSPTPFTTQARVDSHPFQAPPPMHPVHMESQR